jgi:hypothetical protein
MNRWIISGIFFLVYISQVVLPEKRDLVIKKNGLNQTIPLWMDDAVAIQASDTLILEWFFNNISIVKFVVGPDDYTYPNTAILNNITAMSIGANSFLNLSNVSHVFTGIYEADDDGTNSNRYSLNMTVHGNNLCKSIYLFLYNF